MNEAIKRAVPPGLPPQDTWTHLYTNGVLGMVQQTGPAQFEPSVVPASSPLTRHARVTHPGQPSLASAIAVVDAQAGESSTVQDWTGEDP